MYPSELPPINLNNPAPDSILNQKFLDPDYLFEYMVRFFQYIFRKETLTDLNTLLVFFALFFMTLTFYCIVRLFEIRAKEHKHLHHEIEEYAHHQAEREKKQREGESVSHNEHWVRVLDYVFSPNAADWKLAVIEADNMLEALLSQLGFEGESLGDRLKAASQEEFRNLAIAWEVHTVRNRIAHEGSNFPLSQHEAKRVVALYEGIFRQYGYI
ncbi:MAG TPA: hypothetical protein VJC14_01235 [Candidatus Paceibacterota bacterium]